MKLDRSFLPAVLLFFLAGLTAVALDQTPLPRGELSLSDSTWRVWLDTSALWQADRLYVPREVNLAAMPVNAPSGGWKSLDDALGQKCELPATVEEIFSGGVNTYRYHGVSWFWRSLSIPAPWAGRKIVLHVEKQRMRMEVYVNQKLAGYDLIPETPSDFDLTPFVHPGQSDRLAIRLTNAGGNRGWEDVELIPWGKYQFPSSHDFSGLGHVDLEAVPLVRVEDVFVKNMQPAGARNIEVQVTAANDLPREQSRNLQLQIEDDKTGQIVAQRQFPNVALPPGTTKMQASFTVANAVLWDLEHPVLYRCRASLLSSSCVTDKKTVRFGFRVFEVKSTPSGGAFYFLNGKRLRLSSAIDFGFYAFTGMFPTPQMAENSVQAARAINHNALSFHRRIGEPLVMDEADHKGLYLYEEPGGFHEAFQGNGPSNVAGDAFTSQVELEKCRRMFLRDRNHPALLVYNLSNEDTSWDSGRETAMKMEGELDGTRLVSNSSGHTGGGPSGPDYHLRPYETDIRRDLHDDHTVHSESRFQESDFGSHQDRYSGDGVVAFGEVRCYAGPADFPLLADLQKSLPLGWPGYDSNIYLPLASKIAAFCTDFDLASTGSRVIQTPADFTRQAGRGLMYIDGRLGQTIMTNNSASYYAINGWSSSPQVPNTLFGDLSAFDSGMCDEGRNLKGPAVDCAYWTRPVQIAITRRNGKYFNPGQTAEFGLALINEGKLEAGAYDLKISVLDGAGKQTSFSSELPVTVAGGDTYAQPLTSIKVPLDPSWHAGHITVQAELDNGLHAVADGSEQVLLKNRATWHNDLSNLQGEVVGWPAAEKALAEANATLTSTNPDYILMAGPPDAASLKGALSQVHDAGSLLILKFDAAWANALLEQGVLTQPVTEWGGAESTGWNGNGWGYLDHFIGGQAVPFKTAISTNSWEVPGEPMGFWPLETTEKKYAYGAYVARPGMDTPQVFNVDPALIHGKADSDLYSSCFYHFNELNLDVPNGTYRVTLKFCEPYFDGPGKRTFDVGLQGTTVLQNLDLYAKAGKLAPWDHSVDHVGVTDGHLRLKLGDNGCISGLVIEGRQSDGQPFTRKIACGREAVGNYSLPRSWEMVSLSKTLLVLIGGFDYGKGRVLLDASYPVDAESPLNDMLFFNLITTGDRDLKLHQG
jgi:hypothetical protein